MNIICRLSDATEFLADISFRRETQERPMKAGATHFRIAVENVEVNSDLRHVKA